LPPLRSSAPVQICRCLDREIELSFSRSFPAALAGMPDFDCAQAPRNMRCASASSSCPAATRYIAAFA
jgi:hypothetical protein